MKPISFTIKNCFLPLMAAVAVCIGAVSCEKTEVTDGDRFSLFYPGITDIGPSTNMNLNPTYHGARPSDFRIYRVTLDGAGYQTDCFLIDAASGQVQLRNTDLLPVGLYSLSISCVSAGRTYEFPDAVSVNMMLPIPEGIVVEPSKIELRLEDLTNLDSDVEIPSAQITTEGEHISIKNYHIAAVRRDGVLVEDWSGLFSIDNTGRLTILRNRNFSAGVYVLDFKLTTMVVGNDSQDGIFADALTVDVVSPPIALSYVPEEVKVEAVSGYTSQQPVFTGSAAGLEYSLKSVMPEGVPVSVDPATGVITLAEDHGLEIGTEVYVSLNVRNAYGEKDFDQVLKMTVVAYIAPITMLDYNDSTVWHDTKFAMSPLQADGDEVTYSFVDLPEALSALELNPVTGRINASKGNGIALGEYTVTIKAENPKGSMTADILLNVIENPYFFTYVRWGNNLGLKPEEDYASQHRVSTTEAVKIGVTASDIKEGTAVTYAIKGGSNTKCVAIDEATGEITTDPSVFEGKIANMRAHFFFVTATAGAGTSGETTVRTPVFLDFNCPRAEGGYTVQYTPFVFQCNPKTGGVSAAPVITMSDGSPVADMSKITMDYRRSFNYWNIDGPESHVNGDPKVEGGFLNSIWTDYYAAIGKALNTGSRDPLSYYGRAFLDKNAGYIRAEDLSMYVAPEKWQDENGYADGIFVGQITLADTGADPQGAKDPYRLFPLFVWFDTEF